MEKNKLNVRKVKCITKCAKKGERILHPLTLLVSQIKEDNKCGINYKYDKKDNVWDKTCEENESITDNELVKFMALPYLNLGPEQLIKMYDVEDIEKLKKWIDNSIKKEMYYESINRILNAWIRSNYVILLKNNNFLEDIYLKISDKYWKNIVAKKNNIGKFINSWFMKKKYNDFKLNLGNDLKNFLSN